MFFFRSILSLLSGSYLEHARAISQATSSRDVRRLVAKLNAMPEWICFNCEKDAVRSLVDLVAGVYEKAAPVLEGLWKRGSDSFGEGRLLVMRGKEGRSLEVFWALFLFNDSLREIIMFNLFKPSTKYIYLF